MPWPPRLLAPLPPTPRPSPPLTPPIRVTWHHMPRRPALGLPTAGPRECGHGGRGRLQEAKTLRPEETAGPQLGKGRRSGKAERRTSGPGDLRVAHHLCASVSISRAFSRTQRGDRMPQGCPPPVPLGPVTAPASASGGDIRVNGCPPQGLAGGFESLRPACASGHYRQDDDHHLPFGHVLGAGAYEAKSGLRGLGPPVAFICHASVSSPVTWAAMKCPGAQPRRARGTQGGQQSLSKAALLSRAAAHGPLAGLPRGAWLTGRAVNTQGSRRPHPRGPGLGEGDS